MSLRLHLVFVVVCSSTQRFSPAVHSSHQKTSQQCTSRISAAPLNPSPTEAVAWSTRDMQRLLQRCNAVGAAFRGESYALYRQCAVDSGFPNTMFA